MTAAPSKKPMLTIAEALELPALNEPKWGGFKNTKRGTR